MALVVYPALRPSSLRELYVFLGVIGVGVLIVAVVAASPGLIGLGLLILFSEYGASLITNEHVDWAAPVYAAAILLLAEIAYPLAARQQASASDGRRIITVIALAIASGYVVLGMVAIPLPHGALLQALGAGGAALLVLTLARLTRTRA